MVSWYGRHVRLGHNAKKISEEYLARYSAGQASLHELSARLQRASSAEEIYAAAIDAMFRSLECARASVLLVDAQGEMHFVAARGLSADYMRAVDGHSPWNSETKDAKPIYVRDVRQSELSADLRTTLLSEGIEALAFIPLQGADQLLGKFMLYYDEPHSFSTRETEIAITIARHVSFGLERLQALRSAQQLAAIVESSSDAIVSKDLNATILTWNQGAERLFGYTAEEAVGQCITMLIPPERRAEEPVILERIRAGERIEHFEPVRETRVAVILISHSQYRPSVMAWGGSLGRRRSREISAIRRPPRRSCAKAKRACRSCFRRYRRSFTPPMLRAGLLTSTKRQLNLPDDALC